MADDLIFVTGGTGFLGQHLVPALHAAGYRVRLFVHETSPIKWLDHRTVQLCHGNVNDPQSIAEGIKGCRYLVHAAGHFRFWGPHEVFDQVNLEGTKNVVQAAIEHGIERMIHISTIAVVGDPRPGELINEEVVCRPQDPYQHSKLTAEKYVQEMARSQKVPALILRPGAFYGPGSTYGFNRLFIGEPMIGWRVRVEGGRRLTFPVFVPDVAQIVLRTLNRGRLGEVYNISDQSITHNALNEIVSETLNISHWRFDAPNSVMIALAALQEGVAKITGREPFYPLNLRHYVFNDWNVSSAKARLELGFEPTPIEEGIHRTIDWYLEQRGK